MLSNLSQNSQGCNKYTFCLYTSSSHAALYNRVSQKKQMSEFWYATNPSGFHRLDEPPEKISALYTHERNCVQSFLVFHCNYNGEIGQKFDFLITFDWRVLLT